MKLAGRLRDKARGITETISRFFMMTILLIAAVITNAVSINRNYDENSVNLLVSFLLGACIYAVFRMIYERFFRKTVMLYLLSGITLLITFLYYLIIRANGWKIEITLRTTVIFFVLLIAFIWIPVIRSRYNFNDSFMAIFKAFFAALFFNGILFLGITLIFGATDLLITSVDEKLYMHAANLIFVLSAPIHMLSLIPRYPRDTDTIENTLPDATLQLTEENQAKSDSNPGVRTETVLIEEKESSKGSGSENDEIIRKLITPVRFLSALVSYVIIPITAVFTLILLLYIIMNFTGDFWTDNLLEPLLVAYSITVIIVYLLASTIENAFTKYFRKIFPKVLLPIVIFQTIASVLKIREAGIGYGRYYVILFGIFATIAGTLFCIRPVRKNGLIAPVLIGLSILSILPGCGAFDISRINQISRLERVLEQNGMLQNDRIIPDSSISEADRQIIISSVEYLNRMEYTKDIIWLKNYALSGDFEETFGFAQYPVDMNNYRYVMIIRDQTSPIIISGYDYMVRMHLYRSNDIQPLPFEKGGKSYQITLEGSYEEGYDIVLSESGRELVRFPMNEVYERFNGNQEKTTATTPEVTFTEENEQAALTVVAENISISQWEDGIDREADIYVLVKIK